MKTRLNYKVYLFWYLSIFDKDETTHDQAKKLYKVRTFYGIEISDSKK